DPMQVLARSGGSRATDAVELFPFPVLQAEVGYTTHFLARAIRHLPETSQGRILTLQPSARLWPMRDCQNEHDPLAVALRTDDRVIVGYMPSYLLEDALHLIDNCDYLAVYVERVNPPPA